MKAVILAAGKGTRMKELTNEIPKPMLRVQGRPILEHIITGLKSAGVSQFFIVTGWRAEVVEEYFGDGSNWEVNISYGRQLVQDGTGKAPELAQEFVGPSPFILTYGDILPHVQTGRFQSTLIDLEVDGGINPDTAKRVVEAVFDILVRPETYAQMIHRYNEDYFSGVVTVTGSEDVTKGGLFFFDEKFCLKHLVEKPPAAQVEQLRRDGWLKAGEPAWYNAGIYIFRPSLFEFTAKLEKSPRDEYELTDAITGLIAAHHPLAGLRIEGRWVDVRDPEVLAKLEAEEA